MAGMVLPTDSEVPNRQQASPEERAAVLLAEALATRKAALTKITELENRIAAAAVSYEGEAAPDEDAGALLIELDALCTEFESLSTRINRTNNDVTIRFDGREMSMMEAVAFREALLLGARATKRIADAIDTTMGKGRYGYGGRRTKDELKQVVHLSPATMRKSSDQVAQQLERLNIAMQSVNWTTEVIE